MVDLTQYQCRCGELVSVMLGKCPRCGSPRFEPPAPPVKGTLFLGDKPIAKITITHPPEGRRRK